MWFVRLFLQVTRERTSERRVIIYIYKSSLDRPDGCIITIIIVERESETRVEPFRSSRNRQSSNERSFHAHDNVSLARLSSILDFPSTPLWYPLFQFLYPLLFSSYTPPRGIVGWIVIPFGGMFNWIVRMINGLICYWNLFKKRYEL